MASACGVRLSRGGDGVDDALAIVVDRDGFDDLFAGLEDVCKAVLNSCNGGGRCRFKV